MEAQLQYRQKLEQQIGTPLSLRSTALPLSLSRTALTCAAPCPVGKLVQNFGGMIKASQVRCACAPAECKCAWTLPPPLQPPSHPPAAPPAPPPADDSDDTVAFRAAASTHLPRAALPLPLRCARSTRGCRSKRRNTPSVRSCSLRCTPRTWRTPAPSCCRWQRN